jgi:hypothetical protein
MPFPSPIYFSSSSQKSCPIFEFERTFEVIRKTKKIIKKHERDITLGSLEEKQVLVSKSFQFPFQILRKSYRRMICNKNNKCHYIKRSLLRNRFIESPYSQQEAHEENKSTSNGCTSAWEESANS